MGPISWRKHFTSSKIIRLNSLTLVWGYGSWWWNFTALKRCRVFFIELKIHISSFILVFIMWQRSCFSSHLWVHRIHVSVYRSTAPLRVWESAGWRSQCSCAWMDGTDSSTVTYVTQIIHVKQADWAPSWQLSGEPSQ